jgi:hypothetical protein
MLYIYKLITTAEKESSSFWVRVSSKQSNFFFRFEPKQTETQSVSVVFRFVSRNQKTFFSDCFGLFRCFGSVSKQPKQTQLCQNKQKNLQKTFYIRGSSKQLIFVFLGSNRNKLKINLFRLFFGLFYAKPNNFFFGLFRCFGLWSKQPKQTELKVWGIKKVDIFNNFAAVLVVLKHRNSLFRY